MKIGYPGSNLGLGCTSSHIFRLASYGQEVFIKTAQANLDCLHQTIAWNIERGLLFFRISSGIIPFASHPVLDVDWRSYFASKLTNIGRLIKDNDMRISMHPGHFVALTSKSEAVFNNSVRELQYHADFMNALGLDAKHKFQIHLGGHHGDELASLQLFVDRYNSLQQEIRDRLVIENDERFVSVEDCLVLSEKCGIPILFDTLHHEIKNNGESLLKGVRTAISTWSEKDGVPMIDYSNQDPWKKVGAHSATLDVDKFRQFIKSLKGLDVDIIFEIKNKEASALQAQIVLDTLKVLK